MLPLCVVLCKSHECVCVSKLEQGSTMFWEYYSSSLLDMVFLDPQFLSIRRLILVRSGDSASETPDAAEVFRISDGSDMGCMRASAWHGWPAEKSPSTGDAKQHLH